MTYRDALVLMALAVPTCFAIGAGYHFAQYLTGAVVTEKDAGDLVGLARQECAEKFPKR